jgi:small subunit ribosomal protein S9
MAKDSYFYALGRRKSATARVRLQSGKGAITINGKPAAEYLAESKYLLNKLEQPLVLVDLNGKYDVSAVVTGGGHEGQTEAIRLGIAKALS